MKFPPEPRWMKLFLMEQWNWLVGEWKDFDPDLPVRKHTKEELQAEADKMKEKK